MRTSLANLSCCCKKAGKVAARAFAWLRGCVPSVPSLKETDLFCTPVIRTEATNSAESHHPPDEVHPDSDVLLCLIISELCIGC